MSGKEQWPAKGQTLKENNGNYIGGANLTENQYINDIYINQKGELILVPSRKVSGENTFTSNEFSVYNALSAPEVLVRVKNSTLDGAYAEINEEAIKKINEHLKKYPNKSIEKLESFNVDAPPYMGLGESGIIIHTKGNAKINTVKEYRYPAKIGIKFTDDI